MQFVKCVARMPGLFDRRVLDFSDRLTIVYGKNGSGKSLLARAMIDAIWGRFSNRRLLENGVWDSLFLDVDFVLSESGVYSVSNDSDGYYRLRYRYQNDEALLYSGTHRDDIEYQDPSASFDPCFESRVFREFMGRIDADMFINSSFVPSPADLARGPLVDPSVLRRTALDDGTGFYGTYLRLGQVFGAGDGSEAPVILRYEDLKRELDKKLQILDISDSRHDKLIREKTAIQHEIDELNTSLASLMNQKEILGKIIENLSRVEMLKKEFDGIKEEIQGEQQKIKSISDMNRELETLFPQFSDMDVNDSTNLDRLQEVFNEIRNLNERIDGFFFMRDVKKRMFRKMVACAGAFTFAVELLLAARNGFNFMKDIVLAGVILGLAVAVIAGMIVWLLVSLRDREVMCFEETKMLLKVRIRSLMEKSRVELEDFKLTEIYELLLQYFEDYVNYAERKKDLARLKSSLKEEEYMRRIQQKLDELKKEEQIIKDEIHVSIDTLNIVDDIGHETSRIEELIQNIDVEAAVIREKVETKERIIRQIDSEFVQSSGNGGAVNALMEERNNVERILRKWNVNRNSMQFIAKLIVRAVERSGEKQFRRLVDGALDRFNHLTGNQYITLIDDAAVLRLVHEPDAAQELAPPVAHALLIAIVCSLSDFITGGGISIPLLIDEPFQFMDDERCGRFRDLVSYVSNRRQVIIFTHQSDKRNWGYFIEL